VPRSSDAKRRRRRPTRPNIPRSFEKIAMMPWLVAD
jgi:hypothetical protein